MASADGTSGHIIFRRHAIRRMLERKISVDDVRWILEHGEVIATYAEARPYPKRAIAGSRGARPLHIVVADAPPTIIVITVYEPDPNRWSGDFRRRIR